MGRPTDVHRILAPGATGEDVRKLIEADNHRLRALGLDSLVIPSSNGNKVTQLVRDRTRLVLQSLGALPATRKKVADPGINQAMQHIVRYPDDRSSEQVRRAVKWKRSRGYKKLLAKEKPEGAKAAIAFARKYLGKSEVGTSNLAPWGLTSWIQQLLGLSIGVAWCGVFVWAALSKGAGVKGLTSRCASVYYTLQDALAGRNGFVSCPYRRSTGHGSVTAGRQGDVVGLFGEDVHMALITRPVPGGYMIAGGNTSPPNSGGSESNGGCCAEKFYSYSDVAYIARPAYPR